MYDLRNVEFSRSEVSIKFFRQCDMMTLEKVTYICTSYEVTFYSHLDSQIGCDSSSATIECTIIAVSKGSHDKINTLVSIDTL